MSVHGSYEAVLVHAPTLVIGARAVGVLQVDGLSVLVVRLCGPAYPFCFEVHELSTGFVGHRNRLELPQPRESVTTLETNHRVPVARDAHLGAGEVHDHWRAVQFTGFRILDQQDM